MVFAKSVKTPKIVFEIFFKKMERKEIAVLVGGILFAIGVGIFTFYLQIPDKAQDDKKDSKVENSKVENSETEISNFNQAAPPQKGDLVAEIDTKFGPIKFKLFENLVPKMVENFQTLADRKYYDGIIFHRIIPDFMIQTGDPTGTGRGGESAWGGKFDDEFSPKLTHLRGAVSMANGGENTNGSQFFIVSKRGGTGWLDPFVNGEQKDCGKPGTSCHAIFGQVFEGMEIIEQIENLETGANDKPIEEIKMDAVKVYRF